MRTLVVFVALCTLLAGCAGDVEERPDAVEDTVAAEPVDLGPGDLDSTRMYWQMPVFVVQGSQGAYPIQYQGEATIPEGDGPFPVAILMHGRHSTCAYLPILGGPEFFGQPCPRIQFVMEPVESYQGYRPLAEHLASHGIASVSVSANDVNDYDLQWSVASDDSGATARGRLVLQLLADLRAAQQGEDNGVAEFASALDLDRIGLMGHSRGGEGVVRAQVLNIEEGHGWNISAVFALAPTDFSRWQPTHTDLGVLLPYCDGDVYNLQGAWLLDDLIGNPDRGDLMQFIHLGANHNFYNTVWTGDDFGNRNDEHCDRDGGKGRLDMETQLQEGVEIMSSFFRNSLLGDEALHEVMTGDQPIREHIHATFIHAGAEPAFRVTDPAYNRTSGRECSYNECDLPRPYNRGQMLHATWSQEGSLHYFAKAEAGLVLTWRLAVDPDADLAGVDLRLLSGDDVVVEMSLQEAGAFVPPGSAYAKTMLDSIRVPLPADIDEVVLVGDAGTSLLLGDAFFLDE